MIRELKQFYVSFTNWLMNFVVPTDLDDVLIVRLDQLGDFVLWLDSAKEYRKLWHGKRLTLLVNANWYDLAKSLPYWDDVIPLDTIKFRLNIFYRIQMMAYIRSKGFEIAISPRHSVKFTLEPPIIATCGAMQKIVCEGSFPIEHNKYFTRSIPMRPDVHELIRNADFLRGLGRKDFKSTVPKIFIEHDKYEVVIICPTSFRKRKEWPMVNFIEIMSRIVSTTQMMVVVASDQKIKLPKSLEVVNISGNTNVMGLIDRIANCSLVIANDSAPIHLATALDVPSICIGVEVPNRFFPYFIEKPREGMVLPRVIDKNVKDISVDEVYEVVKSLLDKPNG